MNGLYLAHEGISESRGISKKILAQCKGLSNNGVNIFLCHLESVGGNRIYYIEDQIVSFLGKGLISTYRFYTYYTPFFNYIKKHDVRFVYIRYNHIATPFYVFFLKKLKELGLTIVMEIPTYPYDSEHVDDTFKQRIISSFEKRARKQFKKYVDRIVTVQNYDEIFGIPTIKISNGIDLDKISLRTLIPHEGFNLLGVANLKDWHGYDRLIEGIGLYYKNGGKEDVHFYLIGNNTAIVEKYNSIATKYGISEKIHFEGEKQGEELDEYFNTADLAIGSLGFHRIGLIEGKPLKCAEYAARGIPFIYSNINVDFDDKDYVMRVSADETPIDIKNVLNFIKGLKSTVSSIRNDIAEKGTWDYQMLLVLQEIIKTKND